MAYRKFRNKRLRVGDIDFDSELEYFVWDVFQNNKLGCQEHIEEWQFQKPIQLAPSFKFNDETVGSISIVIDFFVVTKNKIFYIDTKGYLAQHSAIKLKMLKRVILDSGHDKPVEVVLINNKGEVANFILYLMGKFDKFYR